MKRLHKMLAGALAGMMLLTACSGGGSDTGDKGGDAPKDPSKGSTVEISTKVENEGEPIEGGVLKVGLVLSSPFKGMFNPALYSGADDSAIMLPTMWGSFNNDADFKITEGGPVTPSFDVEAKTATIKIDEKYTWSDGTPVTVADFIYYYKILADKDYTGVRYDSDFKNVVGMEEYHAGTATEISGLEVVDDKTLVIHFKEMHPGILWGGGIPFEPVPAHQLAGIPVKDLESSDVVRKNPVSCGPYYISEVVPGEKVLFKANEHFWRGKAHIPEVMMEVVSPDVVGEAIKSGKYDLVVDSYPTDKYDQIKDLNNIKIVGRPGYVYNYVGFKLGKWDPEKKQVVTDPNAKMNNVNLRRAMGHALDMQAMSDNLYFGLRSPADSLIPPPFTNFRNENPNAILYNKEKAIQLLDEAGYVDKDNDGFRENPDGSKLEINVATMSGGDLGENLALFYTQSWQEIGLNAVLATGRPIEFNAFYEKVQADDPGIDVFMGAWSTGSNPEPSGLYGRDAQFNYSRYASEELDKILADINSVKSFDDDFRNDAYKRFEEYMINNAPVVPIQYRMMLRTVNNRVKAYDWSYAGPYSTWAELQLTAAEPIAHQ
ncbi:MAG: oligopeptide ABC transporter substrate-binding protein [Peptostreptococcaceae bacterium]|nr:oligopeptide ABC transporter substrate-binding protein [Peptostreptococcaceae bacterium]